jgi:hypothetical protein
MKLTLKHAIAAILLILSLAAPVVAGPFEDAVAAFGKGDYATALNLMRPLAEQGYAEAQYRLGLMYGHQNDAEAMKSLPTKGTPAPNTISGSGTTTAGACRGTTPKR